MSTENARTSSRASLERGVKIALALAVLLILVFALVGRQGRLAAVEALTSDPAAPALAVSVPRTPVPRIAAPSLAEAPIGRSLPPALASADRRPGGLAGPKAESVTAAAEQMGPPAPRARLLSMPLALDNTTLSIGVSKIQLLGIEPMAISEMCGTGAEAWRCGVTARTALRGWLRSRSVNCIVPDDFEKKRLTITTRCKIGEEDVALWLVENGWARATSTGSYYVAGEKARGEGRGIWHAGNPTAP